ncbi:MAG: hypothetical protein CVU48_01100 [Candidatus Cloacimonetes bacterium HGW-Cloacimonetes-1]|jgi:uncharacterized membrane protein YbhN (UPF0104 family)|nr:MAG: hypothetical protein CVU48_01100 [Candidatus Cloacimonetes bacterium HGW-Cloacimonetes-1]
MPINKRWFKLSLTVLKLAVSAGILYFIFSRFEISVVLHNILSLPLYVVLLMVITTVYKHYTQYIVWKNSLQFNPGFLHTWKQVFVSYMIGIPLRYLIPGGSASYGKMLYIQNTSKVASAVAVTSEKFFMTWMSWLMGAIAVLFLYPTLAVGIRITLCVVTVSIPILMYFVLGVFSQTRDLQPNYARKAPKLALIQFSYVCTTLFQMWMIFNLYHPISFWSSSVHFSMVTLVSTIPITLFGLGVRESLAMYFFHPLGFGAEQAVAATLTLFVFHDMIPALIGTVIWLKVPKTASS